MTTRSGGDATGRLTVVSRSREAPPISARAFLADNAAPRVQWTDPDGFELLGVGAATRLSATGGDRFDVVRNQADALFDEVDHRGPSVARPRFFGGFAFTDDHHATPPWSGFDASTFVLPTVQLTRTDDTGYVTVTTVGEGIDPTTVEQELDTVADRLAALPSMRPAGDPPGVTQTTGTPDRSGWHDQVQTVLEKIDRGDLRKVVLARALQADLRTELEATAVIERLRHRYHDCYRFLIQPTDAAAFFGAPPELMVRRSGRAVATEALAGSVDRGDTPEADAELADRLRTSDKLQREQGMVVDAIVDQLAPLGPVSVGDQRVRRLTNIQHLHTPITADLETDHHVLDLVRSLHPTPAVGGVPPRMARETIRETEGFDRGWYAGPVGWFDAAGDGEFAVAIRSAVGADHAVTLYAGNGIVADSDPDEEWAELQPKYTPILDELE